MSVLNAIDLNLLVVFDALLAEGSVTGAAQRLHLSTPATSRALARVRDAVGDPVFVRAGRGLVPTPRALAMQSRVRALLVEAEALVRSRPLAPHELRRTLTIRANDAVTAVLAEPLLRRVASSAPGITLRFVAEGTEDVAALRDGSVDLDVGVQGALGPEVRTRALFPDRVVALQRSRAPLTLKRFVACEHVMVSRRGLVRGPIDEQLERRGLSRTVRVTVPGALAASALAAQCDVLAIVSAAFADTASQLFGLHAREVPLPLPAMSIAMAWHPRFDAEPAHAWLREQLVATTRARGGGRSTRS